MNELDGSSTWKNGLVPRGKYHNKTESKTTVSLYLDKSLVERARNRKLNLSKVTEQALSSILDYVGTEQIKTTPNFLSGGSFAKENPWAGRSVWYDRHVGIVEVPGSNPGPSTTREPGIFNVVWNLKNKGYSDRTLQGISKRLIFLAKNVGLNDPEKVKAFIASGSGGSAYKESLVNAYVHYVRVQGLVWNKPVYKRNERLPNVPTVEQVNRIIAHAGRKYALVFSILRDTGLRPVELSRLTLRDIDLEVGNVNPETAKGGLCQNPQAETFNLRYAQGISSQT